MSEKLGQEPAFPYPTIHESGISKRFYAACAAMSGICADPNIVLNGEKLIINVETAYAVADELLKQENQ